MVRLLSVWSAVLALGCSRDGFVITALPPGDFAARIIAGGDPPPGGDDRTGDAHQGDPQIGDANRGDDNPAGDSNDLCSTVVCTASDPCHDVGICDPLTGMCSDPQKMNGAPCNDELQCTDTDECMGGVCTGTATVAANVIYVDGTLSAAGDGSDWCNAFASLQNALASASSGSEIWVAAARYSPGSARDDSFNLAAGVELYGGFAVGETARSQRDPSVNVTELDGDVNGDDLGMSNRTDNNYHVVEAENVDATAVLDGFFISRGHADAALPHNTGGGIRLSNSNPSLRNLTVRSSFASSFGGGIGAVSMSSLSCTDCNFTGNWSSGNGGGVYGLDVTLVRGRVAGNSAAFGGGVFISQVGALHSVGFVSNVAGTAGGAVYSSDFLEAVNCEFVGNSTTGNGGALQINTGTGLQLTQCTFTGNHATFNGGAVDTTRTSPSRIDLCSFSENTADGVGDILIAGDSAVTVSNSILWGNSGSAEIFDVGMAATVVDDSIVRNGWAGAGSRISTMDPLFADPLGPDGTAGTADEDLSLQAGSPALDACNESTLPPDTFDLDTDSIFMEPLPLDILGLEREVDQPVMDSGIGTAPLCDLGAFERQ